MYIHVINLRQIILEFLSGINAALEEEYRKNPPDKDEIDEYQIRILSLIAIWSREPVRNACIKSFTELIKKRNIKVTYEQYKPSKEKKDDL